MTMNEADTCRKFVVPKLQTSGWDSEPHSLSEQVTFTKRHERTIQRKDLDALRGSLYRFNAIRGTIIATAPFSKGTADATFATGAASITLIDGDKLIDLLIEHGIGVKKNKIEVLSVDADAFADLEPEA